MTDYPHWPFEVSQINRSDRALRELFGVAYYPGTVVEGEPASGDRQAFVSGIFGDIFDVLVAAEAKKDAIDSYRAVVVGGSIEWNAGWAKKLEDYVRRGGVVVLNSAQVKGLGPELLGIKVEESLAEADTARCLSAGEEATDLSGQVFRYKRVALRGGQVLMQSPTGDPLVTVNKVGKGSVVFCALPDLLGMDERITPFAAHMIVHLFSNATPLKITGDVEYLVNRKEGSWVVTLFNNNGVIKPQQGLAQVDRTARVTARISLSGKSIQSAAEWLSDKSVDVQTGNGRSEIKIEIPAGGIAIVELK
jgi:hypothetical protein